MKTEAGNNTFNAIRWPARSVAGVMTLRSAIAAGVLAAVASASTTATAAEPFIAVNGAVTGADDGLPLTLRDTGLYQDWDAKLVGADKLRFSPQYPLWTDGAIKTRWIQLPPGTSIDASHADVWQFPVGTKFWKEFKFARRAETRYIERTAQGWKYATYAWNEDETQATLAPSRGIRNSVPISGDVRHRIPSRSDCRACHEGSPGRILGFSALQLSADRDPNALHAEPLPEGAVTLRTLIQKGLLRGLPAHLNDGAPRIVARTPTARAALGYLHGNCSGCHTLSGELASIDFSLHYPLSLPPSGRAPAQLTTIGHASKFLPPGWEAPAERVRAGDPDKSVLATRMATRNPYVQMPPIGTSLVDEEAVALIRRWILEEVQLKETR